MRGNSDIPKNIVQFIGGTLSDAVGKRMAPKSSSSATRLCANVTSDASVPGLARVRLTETG